MVLIPSKPSPFDVWACAEIVQAVKARHETTGGLPTAAFVITMARPRTRLVRPGGRGTRRIWHFRTDRPYDRACRLSHVSH